MHAQTDTRSTVNAILFTDDAETAVLEWTLHELNQCADLESVKTAWMRTDGPAY